MFVGIGRPVTGDRTGLVRPVIRTMSAAVIAAGLAIPSGAALADSPGAIMKKMVDTYSTATAYAVTIVTHQKGKTKDGKPFGLVKSQIIKYKAPNLFNLVVSFKGEGAAAGKVERGDQTVVADGKMLTAYNPALKQYVKKPDLAKVSVLDLLDILKHLPTKDQPNVKLLRSDTVNGRSVSVVEISPMMPVGLTVDQQKNWKAHAAMANPLDFYIDKQNSALLKIIEVAKAGTVDVDLENQLFNSNIPTSAFAYTPPAGSKQVQPPPNASPGNNLSHLGPPTGGAPAPAPHK